jgi:uroporphyrinogen decarboxylase
MIGGRNTAMVVREIQMTDRECIEALLHREKAERVVDWEFCTIGFAAIQAGMSLAEAYDDPAQSYYSQKRLAAMLDIPFHPTFSSLGNDFNGVTRLPDGMYAQAPLMADFPIKTEADVWELAVPKLSAAATLKSGLDFCRLCLKETPDLAPFNATLSVAGPFTMAVELCGVKLFSKWMITRPQLIHRLLRITTDYLLQAADIYWGEFGTARLLFNSSEPSAANQIFSPRHFVQFAFPYIKEMHEMVLQMGYKSILCHICGDQTRNMPHWAQIPMGDPGIVSIGHEVDLETAAFFFPKDVIQGNLNPIILQTEKPEQIYEAARDALLKGKKIPYRFAFGQGCEIPPKASLENVKAMVRAVHDFGWYGK